MPIYEYRCASCEHRTEVIQRLADPPLETCEECGGKLVKLLSAPAFQFKGSGWYVTDYGKGGKKEGDSDTSRDAKKDEASKKDDGAKSDSGDAKKTGESADSKPKSETKKTSADD